MKCLGECKRISPHGPIRTEVVYPPGYAVLAHRSMTSLGRPLDRFPLIVFHTCNKADES